MVQYISKSALVAKIEKRIKNLYPKGGQGMVLTKVLRDHYEDLLSFLNTLEVQEVDLDEEIEKCLKRHNMLAVGKKDFTDIAKYFFELGLKAQKGE